MDWIKNGVLQGKFQMQNEIGTRTPEAVASTQTELLVAQQNSYISYYYKVVI